MRNAFTIISSVISGAALYKRYLMGDHIAVAFLLIIVALLIIVGAVAEIKK